MAKLVCQSWLALFEGKVSPNLEFNRFYMISIIELVYVFSFAYLTPKKLVMLSIFARSSKLVTLFIFSYFCKLFLTQKENPTYNTLFLSFPYRNATYYTLCPTFSYRSSIVCSLSP